MTRYQLTDLRYLFNPASHHRHITVYEAQWHNASWHTAMTSTCALWLLSPEMDAWEA